MVKAERCEQPSSVQLAELKALTEACKLAKGKVANTYTDSAYAHGVCNLFASVWQQTGFRRMDGSPVQHGDQIRELIAAKMLQSKMSITKCQAHRKGNEDVTRGNNAADKAAKVASKCQMAVLAPMVSPEPASYTRRYEDVIRGNNAADEAAKVASKCQMAVLAPIVSLEPAATPEDIILMQQEAGKSEQNIWKQRGATVNEQELWRSQEGLLVAPVTLLSILISEVHSVDHCARGVVMRKIK